MAAAPRLAVVGVRLASPRELVVLHGYVLEPAWRTRTVLLVESERRLTTLPRADFADPGFGYAYTLERALHLAHRMFRGDGRLTPAPAAGASPAELDAEQLRAVRAHDGVVQVIAPAGSGKTTVLVERVREVLRRGVPANEILCATFNKAASVELQERLAAAGVREVQARTFHGLGLRILTEEGLASAPQTRSLSLGQWKLLCTRAARDDGVWIEPADARAAISSIKLDLLATAAEFRALAPGRENGATIARIYEGYAELQREAGAIDFDDQVMLAVRALRDDAELRARWQRRFSQVLVDEYQDIEPAQERLVRMLAAPQDGFFCVGDEDQTLYGWRRASVRRILDLDAVYPGLQRISLAHNFRCPPEVVTASSRLVEHNAVRFPKPIRPAPGRPPGGAGTLVLHEAPDQAAAARRVARELSGRRRGDVVVLARTTNLLRAVALACAAGGVRISAPPAVFESRGARGALEAYLRLATDLESARPEDVALVCRAPNRGLPYEREEQVAARLRAGGSFAESLDGLAGNDRQRSRLDDVARVLDALMRLSDAGTFVRRLRGAGGLDEHFAEIEAAFGDAEQVELEVLEQAQAEAEGRTVSQLCALFEERAGELRAIRDDRHGIELATIHGAKGREWPEVWLFACEEGQLPHRRALDVTPEQEAAGEGLEAERRLAYVAFTRARARLHVTATADAASRFLTEAGLAPARPYAPPAPAAAPAAREGSREASRAPASRPRPGATRRPRIGPADGRLAEALRVGLGYALRTAPDRRLALQTAAAALEQRLIGEPTTSAKMTAAALLACVEDLADAERRAILDAAGIGDGEIRLSRLDAAGRAGLARALRGRAT